MKLIDMLQYADEELVRNIALYHGLGNKHERFKKGHYISLITGLLTDIERLKSRVFKMMEKEELDTLVKFALKSEITRKQYIKKLTDKGFFINGSMPNDVKEIIECYGRSFAVNQIKDPPIRKQASKLTVSLLLLSFFKEKQSYTYPIKKYHKKNNQISSELMLTNSQSKWVEELIKGFIGQNFLFREKNKLFVNLTAIQNLEQEDVYLRIKNFYSKERYVRYLEKIGSLQQSFNEWVDVDFLPSVTVDIDHLSELGLLRLINQNERTLVQLTPESWYLVKGQYPDYWSSNEIILTADSELFIPSDYDPFIISDFSGFCKLKDNEYFLVYDIDFQGNEFGRFTKKKLSYFLNNHARTIPEVIRYELEH